MALALRKNYARGTLSADITAAVIQIILNSGQTLPIDSGTYPVVVWDHLTYPDPANDINLEIMIASYAGVANTFNVVRAQEGSSAVAHSMGDRVALHYTAQMSADDLANHPHSEMTLNSYHRVSDGKDHSDVVLNNAHRISDGKNHSDVGLNNVHRISNGSDHSYIDQAVTLASTPSFAGFAKIGGAANYMTVEADGTVVFIGDATTWEDVRITPGSFDRPGGSDPNYYAYDVNGSGIAIELTEWAKNDYGTFTVQIPHSYKQGSDIYVHAHWTPGANGVGENGNYVGWKIIYSWANIDGTFGNPLTVDLSDICDGTNHKHQMTPDISITGTSKTISSMLICKFVRTDTGGDDTWAGTGAGNLPLLLEVDFHFEQDTVGSRQLLIK